MTLGYLGFLGIDFLKSVLMYSKGAICLSRLLFKMGLFTVCVESPETKEHLVCKQHQQNRGKSCLCG
jgi:hypothetical protein